MANPFDPAFDPAEGNVAVLGTLAEAAPDGKSTPATLAKIDAALAAAQSNAVSVPQADAAIAAAQK
jgi:hypothetical protein